MNIPIPDTDQMLPLIPGLRTLAFHGKGGFKVVFRGVLESGCTEAIKAIYIPSVADGFTPEQSAQLMARAQREIEALNCCQSQSIVKLGTVAPRPIMVSSGNYLLYSEEFIEGQPLSESVTHPPTVDYATLQAVFSFLLDVIEEMIRIKYLHRDIKPANIMVTGQKERPYVILDLGIAYKMQGTELTQGPTPPGTLRYMAPELLSPDYKDVMDFRCDLYSAGLSLYELASGVNPFAPCPENDFVTAYRIIKQKAQPLETFRPDLPLSFCRIIDRCMKKNPALRYARTELLRKELKEIQ